MKIMFLTVGDPERLTGGYLYHREVFARLGARGAEVTQIVVGGASLAEQLEAAAGLGGRVDVTRYDALVVDALARAAAAPWLDEWRARRPLVAMVHELPSVAGGGTRGQGEGGTGGQGEGGTEGQGDQAEREREAALLRADRLIAVSADGARILVERGAPPEKIVIAPGGLDRLTAPASTGRRPPTANRRPPAADRRPPTADRQPPAADRQPPTVLCVAQWIARKGLAELARAWAAAARPGWRLELVGETQADPGYAAAVLAELAAAPPGSVVVRGPLTDAELAAAYAGASIFALPSRYEGYGIAYAEALAHGLPVLACAVGPLPDLIGPAAGLLVPPGDHAALAAALARLMDDAGLRARMAAAALARARELPTWDDTASGFLRAVREAIADRSLRSLR